MLFTALCIPVVAEEPVNCELLQTQAVQESAENTSAETFEQIKANSNVVHQQEAQEGITYKQPVSKRKIAKKFLLAMAGVAISSIILFVLLSIYNKIRAGFAGPSQVDTGKEPSLETPDNLTDAVRAFLDKTKWDN